MARRARRTLVTAALVGALLSGAAPAQAQTVTVPTSMASLGDSITRGFHACQFLVDCISRSWSTGASNGVTSHFVRLQAIDKRMKSRTNLARTGAEVADLPGQARAAADLGVGYVTILIGANDACASTEAGMTPVADFRAAVEEALGTLAAAPSAPRVLVASVPDVHRLWEVGRTSFAAVSAWAAYGTCQSMLAAPLSTAEPDVARRARVRQRVIDYNEALRVACAAHPNCRYDGGATFGHPFVLADLSTWDYFHPNARGQELLASTTWSAGYAWVRSGSGGGGGGGGKGPRG